MGKFSAPSPPPEPEPPPEPPKAPTSASSEVQAATSSARRRSQAARGRRASFLTGPVGTDIGPGAAVIETKQLLGQ